MDKLNSKQNRDGLLDGEMTASGGAGEGVEGFSKKEKGMNMDNSVVISGGRGYKGTK